jgi:hypothetical protein
VTRVPYCTYEWIVSTIEYHRAQIRDHLRYRVPTAADQETLTDWLSEAVSHAERRPEASHRKPPPCWKPSGNNSIW